MISTSPRPRRERRLFLGLARLVVALTVVANRPASATPEGDVTEPPADAEPRALRELDALDQRVAALAADTRRHEDAAQDARALAAARAASANDVQAALQRTRTRLRAHWALRHRARRDLSLRLLIGAQSPAELVRRRATLDALLAADVRLLARARAERAAARTASALAERAAAHHQRAAAQADGDRRALVRERRRRAERLAALRAERAEWEAVVAAQALRRARWRAVIGASPAIGASSEIIAPPDDGSAAAPSSAAAPGLASARRRLPWPVAPPRAARPIRGGARAVEAWTLTAPAGAPVSAVAAGTVVRSGWTPGFGYLVAIDHGGGYVSLYGHLSAIARAAGERVLMGEVVGELGDSGALSDARLRFELRLRDEPLDPGEWLQPERTP